MLPGSLTQSLTSDAGAAAALLTRYSSMASSTQPERDQLMERQALPSVPATPALAAAPQPDFNPAAALLTRYSSMASSTAPERDELLERQALAPLLEPPAAATAPEAASSPASVFGTGPAPQAASRPAAGPSPAAESAPPTTGALYAHTQGLQRIDPGTVASLPRPHGVSGGFHSRCALRLCCECKFMALCVLLSAGVLLVVEVALLADPAGQRCPSVVYARARIRSITHDMKAL